MQEKKYFSLENETINLEDNIQTVKVRAVKSNHIQGYLVMFVLQSHCGSKYAVRRIWFNTLRIKG